MFIQTKRTPDRVPAFGIVLFIQSVRGKWFGFVCSLAERRIPLEALEKVDNHM